MSSFLETQHSARVFLAVALTATIAGLSIAVVALAASGPAIRWAVGASGFAVGCAIMWLMVRFQRPPQPTVASSPPAAGRIYWVGIVVVIFLVPILEGAGATAEVAGLSVSDGLLAVLAVTVRRNVMRERRTLTRDNSF